MSFWTKSNYNDICLPFEEHLVKVNLPEKFASASKQLLNYIYIEKKAETQFKNSKQIKYEYETSLFYSRKKVKSIRT